MFEDKEIQQRLNVTVPDWGTYTLEIDTPTGTHEIKWEKYIEDLAFYSMFQIGIPNHSNFSLQSFYELHNKIRQEEFDRNESIGAYDLPSNASILDIGAGLGITDLILYNYLPDAEFTLLDKDAGWAELKDKPRDFLNGYHEDYIFYNSRAITKYAIEHNGYDASRFRFMEPHDVWEQYDLIQSTWSYAWHYPLDEYWDNVLQYLKPGGKLLLDVYLQQDIDLITNVMGSEPKACNQGPHGGVYAAKRLCWTRT
tara:strand:- start:263 stop:1024 length:762 start_codon:yes stop_codon:yes gene_type:complete